MKKLLLVLVFLMSGMAVFAQDYSTYKLDNGQTVIIKEVHDNPIVIVDTWINTGSINETDQNNGVAHFLEHLFFKGTTKHPSNEFDRILESKGAMTNAATSKDFTHYYILIPSKDFNLAMNMHADMLMDPLIPRKELEKERKVVLEEISKNNDNPSNLLFKQMTGILYKEHPYKREVIGTKEVIENISREEVLDFYKKWYTPENMTTVIIGDVDTQKALEAVKRNFGVKSQQACYKASSLEYKMDKKPAKKTEVKTPFKVETGYLIMGFKGVASPKSKDSYTLDVLSTILGDGKTSRLYKSVKEQKQLAQNISAGHSSYKHDSIFYISANFDPENLDKVKAAVFSEIDKIKQNGVGEDELKKAKSIIERDTYYSRESVSNISNEIGYTMVLTGDPTYYECYVENIKKVTAEDIKEAAKKYLDENSVAISVVLPDNFVECRNITENCKKYEAKLVSQNKTISKYELPNKATLLVNKNQSNDIVAIEILVKGGNFTEKIRGLGSVTAETMMKGTKKYPNQELSVLLEETGIKIVPSAKADAFSVGIKFTKNESKTALDVLKEVINNATLSSYEIDKIKNDKIYDIKKSRDNPSSVAFDEFKTLMWEGTSYGNSGSVLEKTIPQIKKEDVDSFYKQVFNPENIVISINGNVDEQEFINYFSSVFPEKTYGKKVVLKDFSSQFVPLDKNKISKKAKETQTSWIVLGWQTDGLLNKKDWATLQVIDSLLGSGMSSRLFVELRDQQGLAYQVGSAYSSNYNKGVFAVYIGTNPLSANTSKDGLFSEVNRLKKEFVSDKELRQAKDKLLGNYVLSLETNMDKASTIGWFEASDRGYQFMDEYQGLIEAVTVQDIITVANKYFSKPYVLSVVGPQSSLDKF